MIIEHESKSNVGSDHWDWVMVLLAVLTWSLLLFVFWDM
jgi:hypothetical protein